MPCFYPLHGWRAKHTNPSGKRAIVFDSKSGYIDRPVTVPCGRCQGCRLEHSRQWAIRCIHEAQLHEENSFLTLTYDPEHLPADGSLNHKHFQDFMKRFRASIAPTRIRYFMCGEYGSKLLRPHYHCILFGFTFNDAKIHAVKEGIPLFISETLSNLWQKGFCTIGDVTFESAAYVARYVMKKVNGDDAFEHYMRADHYGEMFHVKPEYVTMSRRPGIASGWYERFKDDVFPSDGVVVNGREYHAPRYYSQKLEKEDPTLYRQIKSERLKSIDAKDNTPERLAVKEKVARARINKLKRELHSDDY